MGTEDINRKLAIIDSVGRVKLYFTDEDDNKMEELGWPDDWPKKVDTGFLVDDGFRIEKENGSYTETDKILNNLKFGRETEICKIY